MSQPTVIEVDGHQHRTISWLDNLIRGARNLILHPFFPFLKSSEFNFKCLFARTNSCCSINGCDHALHQQVTNQTYRDNGFSISSYPHLLESHVKSLISQYNTSINHGQAYIKTDKQPPYELVTRYIFKLTGTSVRRFLTFQLIICTIVLSYYLIRDVKYVIRYMKAKRYNRL